MRLIAIEEHWTTTRLAEALGALPTERRDDSLALNDHGGALERLLDLGAARIAAMDAQGIDVQIVSLAPPGTGPLDPRDAVPRSRELNDTAAAAVAQHPDRIGGGDVERYELGAGGVDVGDEASGVRDDDRFVTGAAQDARKLDSAHVGGARFQSRRDDQDAHRMRGAIRRVKTSAGWRGCRQNRHRQSYPRNRRLRLGGATDIKRSLRRTLLRTSLNDRVIEATYKPRGWLRQRSAART